MQRSMRMNEIQLLALTEKAINDNGLRGYLYKRSSEGGKWQLRWFILFQNLLFYFETESSTKPSGVIFLEGSYCDKVMAQGPGASAPTGGGHVTRKDPTNQHSFMLTYRKEGSKFYEIKAESESECNAWIHALDNASFSKMLLQKEELEQKHLHLVQIVESEKTAKWQYTQQCEELTFEIKKLRAELCSLKKGWRLTPQRSLSIEEEPDEIRKIKKVQSFFRGWLCRRRWKQIVSEYINSPHAENMRKRNSLVFRMVECEEEYMDQLQLLISCFLRPFKMAASSQKPPCTHDEVNSIFLNSETIMFLHQIFLKGLTARMESWPTLVLGDLFDMLVPMLVIYQEYVRNHHFSLQVLAECKQKDVFVKMLRRLEEKGLLQGRTLETFLTYPMHQVPRYIITLHELLAHTPHNHVERRSLENAKSKLEELSKQMHDEVSETENIRKNLAIERIIIGGCDILLDVNQVFVRQGNVMQYFNSKEMRSQSRSFRGSFRGGDKEIARQCFLFSNHILLCIRASNGKLQLIEQNGKIPLSEATLIEEPNEQFQFVVDDGEGTGGNPDGVTSIGMMVPGMSSGASNCNNQKEGSQQQGKDFGGLDFKIIWDTKNGPAKTLHLVAPTMQEKAAWISDVSQCIDNVHFNDLFHGSMNDSSSVTMPHSIRNDPRLYKDDDTIRFSRTLNSCKLPQIRYASPDRLFERLTDLRFLSIDFLNTFLLTYRVFTDGVTVLESLKKVHYSPDAQLSNWSPTFHDDQECTVPATQNVLDMDFDYPSRRISTSSMTSDLNGPQHRESVISTSSDSQVQMLHQLQQNQNLSKNHQHWRLSHRKFEEEQARERFIKKFGLKTQPGDASSPPIDGASFDPMSMSTSLPVDNLSVPVPPAPASSPEVPCRSMKPMEDPIPEPISPSLGCDDGASPSPSGTLVVPHSHSSETLKAEQSYPSSPNMSSATSSATLVGSMEDKSWEGKEERIPELEALDSDGATPPETPPSAGLEPMSQPHASSMEPKESICSTTSIGGGISGSGAGTLGTSGIFNFPHSTSSRSSSRTSVSRMSTSSERGTGPSSVPMSYLKVKGGAGKRASDAEVSFSMCSTPRSSFQTDSTVMSSARSSFQFTDTQQMSSKAGVVVTSSRASARRSSTASAASAFAIATAGSSNPSDAPLNMMRMQTELQKQQSRGNSRLSSAVGSEGLRLPGRKRESMISTAATMRVLNVLRHWISKHSQDFEIDSKLMQMTTEFLEELVHNTSLLPAEHKAASQLLHMITKDEEVKKIDLDVLLSPPLKPSKETIESLSALEIAEGMTYLDHKIFVYIQGGEFLGQAWMKWEKETKAHHILLMTRRFNETSRTVGSEILRQTEMSKRASVIEKWTAVADICRCLHNFNGVLQICAAFTNSSVFRLKKTWEKVCKTSRQNIEKLQSLVSTDGRFRNMRDALRRCDPPCIPYLGMYLTDLSFIEEGTPNFTEDGVLLNFSKMRMIAHVIQDIKHFQQTPYKIENNPKVINYLLDSSRHYSDEELYQRSLCLEPRLSRLSSRVTPSSQVSFAGTSPSHGANPTTSSTTSTSTTPDHPS